MTMTKPTSEQVTFTAAGSGATLRTAMDKLREWVTLADFNGDLAAALAAFGSAAKTFIINQNITISSNITIPATVNVWVENGAIITINSGVTLTINGPMLGYANQIFAGAGKLVFASTAVPEVLPEWFGAKADGSVDCTTAFTKAIAASTDTGEGSGVSILPVRLHSGTYVVGNIVLPPASHVQGAGKWTTALRCKAGTVGAWITDNGNANKIILDGFGCYGDSQAGVTAGIRLGRGANPHGTEGAIRNVHVRDLPNAIGLDVASNVSTYDSINVWTCSNGLYIDGPHASCSNIVAYACTGTSVKLNLVTIQGLEIEAPATGSLPLDMAGNSTIDGLTLSLANNTTISHLIEQRAACTTWSIQGLEYIFPGAPTGIVVSNGNIKLSDGTYVGGNASAANNNGEGNYSSSTFSVNGQTIQSFTTRITNTGGTIQHRVDNTLNNQYCTRIANASITLQNTPTGADATTAFAFGGKIGSASPSVFTYDTDAQSSRGPLGIATVAFTNTGVAYTIIPFLESKNINGVTRIRVAMQLVTTSGTATAWTSALANPGDIIDIRWLWFIS